MYIYMYIYIGWGWEFCYSAIIAFGNVTFQK